MVVDSEWAAVGHFHMQLLFSVIYDAAKVHGLGREVEIREVDFSPNRDFHHTRMLHEAHPENLLYHPAGHTVLISWVKCDAEMKLLPYIHCQRLQGDEQ